MISKGVKSLDRQTLHNNPKLCGIEFDKRQTNIAKGIALLLLLCHHLFIDNSGFESVTFSNGTSFAGIFASLGKVCVAVFLFLSGYGLHKSFTKFKTSEKYKNHPVKSQFRYVINHLIRLFSDYWIVYIIFVPMGIFFGRSFLDVYHGNPVCFLSDLFGVSYLFFKGNATMNATWWFMSIIIIYYIIFPLLYKIQQYSSELLLCMAISILLLPLPNFRELNTYLFPFVFGMYISDIDGFIKLKNKFGSRINQVMCSVLLVVAFAYFRFTVFTINDGLFGFSIILFSFLIVSRIPILNRIIEEIGKYSGSIFMFHTFIIGYYFKDYIYWFKYAILIFLVTVLVCYVIARVLDLLKKMTGYNRLISYLTSSRKETD